MDHFHGIELTINCMNIHITITNILLILDKTCKHTITNYRLNQYTLPLTPYNITGHLHNNAQSSMKITSLKHMSMLILKCNTAVYDKQIIKVEYPFHEIN